MVVYTGPPIHPQSSGYYAPYGQGSPYGGAYDNYGYSNATNNDGGVGGRIAGRALSAVESVAGRDARAQLERGVRSLANSKWPLYGTDQYTRFVCCILTSFFAAGSSLLNKLK